MAPIAIDSKKEMKEFLVKLVEIESQLSDDQRKANEQILAECEAVVTATGNALDSHILDRHHACMQEAFLRMSNALKLEPQAGVKQEDREKNANSAMQVAVDTLSCTSKTLGICEVIRPQQAKGIDAGIMSVKKIMVAARDVYPIFLEGVVS